MNKVQEFVKLKGGTVAVANALRVSPSSVSTWINRGSIPVRQWSKLVECGVATWDELSELHQTVFRKNDDEKLSVSV